MSDRNWYCIGKDGIATLCADKDDAEQSAKLASLDWPNNAPYRAVQLVETDELDALQADADRYRWLARKVSAHGICNGWQFGFPTAITLPANSLAMRDPETALGQCIDAAIAAQKGGAA